jgi:hypothetical protein
MYFLNEDKIDVGVKREAKIFCTLFKNMVRQEVDNFTQEKGYPYYNTKYAYYNDVSQAIVFRCNSYKNKTLTSPCPVYLKMTCYRRELEFLSPDEKNEYEKLKEKYENLPSSVKIYVGDLVEVNCNNH